MTPDARTRTPSSPQPRSTGISPFLGNPPQHDRLLTQFYRRSSRRRGVGRAGVPADRSFPAAASFPSRASSIRGVVQVPHGQQGRNGPAEQSRGHGHTPIYYRAAPSARGPGLHCEHLNPPGHPQATVGAERGRGGWGVEPAERGAGRGAAGGAGPAPPGARKSRPLALGKCCRGACALRPRAPSPTVGPDLGARGLAAARVARERGCARPFGSQGGAQTQPGPSCPHPAFGSLNTGPEEADRPPSMSSHDAAPPAAPSRNPCCLCWCCCCSCSWNQERRRAWQASRESKLQPLPSCEVCATPSPEEVQSWAQSFDKLMHSPAGRSVFRAFLRTEYSEENMLFWLACEELKAEANQHVVDEKARLIYEDYVSILSPKEVSLDSRVREGINKKMQEPSAHTFDDAQLQIYTLMHRDSYPRFLSSPTYRALLLQGPSQSSSEA
uniref:RGS domain-containing protein n=1 Tax=Papio anubis TaxID=9555 RepID=A0A8I5R2D3_PAPAN